MVTISARTVNNLVKTLTINVQKFVNEGRNKYYRFSSIYDKFCVELLVLDPVVNFNSSSINFNLNIVFSAKTPLDWNYVNESVAADVDILDKNGKKVGTVALPRVQMGGKNRYYTKQCAINVSNFSILNGPYTFQF